MYPRIPVLYRHSVLFLVPVEGQPFVLMKPLVLAMGLAWSVQQEKLLQDARWQAQTLPFACQSPSKIDQASTSNFFQLMGRLRGLEPPFCVA